jgi:hypothetical protein
MPKATCSIEGCERPVHALGWCSSHHAKWWRKGDPLWKREVIVRLCSIEGCDRVVAGRGWCEKHYRRWRFHDDPLWEPPTVADRFWAKVDKDGPVIYNHLGKCWVWTAGLNTGGYGQLMVKTDKGWRPRAASCIAYELLVGPIPPETPWVLHHCDNPVCVRADPDPLVSHLYTGTPQNNSDDMWGRGRRTVQPCGTAAAWSRHRRNGEVPCDACREAFNAYHREAARRRKVAG